LDCCVCFSYQTSLGVEYNFNIFSLKVIKGWDYGVLTMTKGEGSRFTLAPHMGYGPGGFPAWGIPPNATLIFDIEVLKINGQ
jgi:peptidylprolyl isomerase